MRIQYSFLAIVFCVTISAIRQHSVLMHSPSGGKPFQQTVALSRPRRDSIARAIIVNGIPLPLDSSVAFGDIQRHFGRAPFVAARNHDDYCYLCYIGRDSLGTFNVVFETNELGGDDHQLFGVELSRTRVTSIPASYCRHGTPSIRNVRTNNHLYLGMPLKDLLRVMGRATKVSKGDYLFDLDHFVGKSTAGKVTTWKYEIDAEVQATITHGRVTRLHVWYAELT